MNLYKYPARETWPELLQRPGLVAGTLDKDILKILGKVKTKGDKAVKKFTREFDGVTIKTIQVSENEINKSASFIDQNLKDAIRQAFENISAFHRSQKEELIKIETMQGVTCWRKSLPIEKVGFYIPGGSAPLFSTVLMLGIPASLAGCREIILCTPPDKDGDIHPAILFAAQCCGINKIFRIGGAQAVAAMAYGTESIPKVFKIFGPGNQYVTRAKQLVQLDGLAIDMPAGPSELMVIADETAEPSFIAADLLSQAEHGPDSQVILISTSESVAEKTKEAILIQLQKLSRNHIAEKALKNSSIILTRSLQEAMEISNLYAPEHLVLACETASQLAEEVKSAGSVFIGNYSPEAAGDYASGTNHTLPTGGYAAMYSGVSLDSFFKKISFQHLTKTGLERIAGTVMHMAAAEQLEAHKNAIAVRLNHNYGI